MRRLLLPNTSLAVLVLHSLPSTTRRTDRFDILRPCTRAVCKWLIGDQTLDTSDRISFFNELFATSKAMNFRRLYSIIIVVVVCYVCAQFACPQTTTRTNFDCRSIGDV